MSAVTTSFLLMIASVVSFLVGIADQRNASPGNGTGSFCLGIVLLMLPMAYIGIAHARLYAKTDAKGSLFLVGGLAVIGVSLFTMATLFMNGSDNRVLTLLLCFTAMLAPLTFMLALNNERKNVAAAAQRAKQLAFNPTVNGVPLMDPKEAARVRATRGDWRN